MNFITTILICSLSLGMVSCVVTKGGGGQTTGGDGLLSRYVDRIVSSEESPTVRSSFIPERKLLAQFKNDPTAKQLERNYFLYTTKFDYGKASIKQRTENDCWAACALMLFKHQKIPFSKSEYADLTNKFYTATEPKSAYEIYNTIINAKHKTTFASPVTQSMLMTSIANDFPLIVGFQQRGTDKGHACLVTAAHFSFGPLSTMEKSMRYECAYVLDKVTVVDPSDGKKRTISGAEFAQTAVFGISFAPEVGHADFIRFKSDLF